jgi:predicted Zn-ribbon and HTH transcriptional regulator
MRKKIAWTYRCPICKAKAFHAGPPIDGEQVCRCTNNLCGHVMTFKVINERTNTLIEDPRHCPTCGSHETRTITHKLFAPYSHTSYRKFMRCTNAGCMTESVLLVTFGKTLSPSAFGTFDPCSGTVTLTKPLEYHAAQPTHLDGTESANARRSGLQIAKPAHTSSQSGLGRLSHRASRGDQQPIRFRWVDCPAT